MYRAIVIILYLIITLTSSIAQTKFPYPVNTKRLERFPVLLPDSSVVLMSTREGTEKYYRFAYDGEEWVVSPNSLTERINALLLNKKSELFKICFSKDYSNVVISVVQFKEWAIYESQKTAGEWELFRQIMQDYSSSVHNLAFSYGSDNNTIYSQPISVIKSMANFVISTRTQNGWQVVETVDLKQFHFISPHEVISLGNGVLVFDSFGNVKEMKWVYMKKISNDEWTAPAVVADIYGGQFALTPSGDSYLSVRGGDVYISDVPQFLKDEIAKARSIEEIAKTRKAVNEETKPQVVNQEPKSESIGSPTYHALLIGISDYNNNNQDLQDLDNPVNDARKLKNVLVANYTFMDENVRVLENPNRAEFINELENLSKKVGEKDNLLIFYAGHGKFDANLNVGYWLAADATTTSKANWISNSTIRHYLAGVDSKHTLLISDACFSGSIFKTREVTNTLDNFGFARMYKLKSRKAITSGTLNTVPDESVFLQYLIKRLSENENQYLPAGWLFHDIEAAVINNTRNIPQYGTIQNSGDEGGDFIFIRK